MIRKIYKFTVIAFRCFSLARFALLSTAMIAPMLFATSLTFAQKNVLHDRAYVKFLLAVSTPEEDSTVSGGKQYELTNHLGNVLATVSDRRLQTATPPIGTSGVTADLLSSMDYYSFGMLMPGRSLSGGNYRFGFNGKENDNELKGDGNQQDYGMRMYDPRVGRFLSDDPLTQKYPELTPYQFASNTPIENIDLDGLEKKNSTSSFLEKIGNQLITHTYTMERAIYTFRFYRSTGWDTEIGSSFRIKSDMVFVEDKTFLLGIKIKSKVTMHDMDQTAKLAGIHRFRIPIGTDLIAKYQRQNRRRDARDLRRYNKSMEKYLKNDNPNVHWKSMQNRLNSRAIIVTRRAR